MEMVYLGLFEKIFNWVLDRIFNPIFQWLTNLLTTIFTWIFNEIFAPILLPVLETVLEFAIELISEIFAVHFYAMYAGLLKLIDYMEAAFDIFIGIDSVTYKAADGTKMTGSLLEVLLQQKTISTIFWILTMAGLGIAMILTIYSVAKSAFDLDFENKRPVSKVLTAMMKTFVQFFTVPFFVYFIIKLATVIIQGITSLMNGGTNTTLGRILFMIASLDAAQNASYNISSATRLKNVTLGTSEKDIIRYPFYSLTAKNAMDYGDISVVADKFYLAKFDYLVGIIAAVFLLFTLAVCLIKFVQRIVEVILLYIVSPYFVSTIPLDDGVKFSKWREMFVGKCFTGFGSVVGMRLYLMICPLIMSGAIDFGASDEMDYLMKLFFLAGGAWAVFKSGPMITNLISVQAGQSESMTQAAVGGMIYAQTAGRMGRAVSSALSKKPTSGKDKDEKTKDGNGKDEKSKQKYTDAHSRLNSARGKMNQEKAEAEKARQEKAKQAEAQKAKTDSGKAADTDKAKAGAGKPKVVIGAQRNGTQWKAAKPSQLAKTESGDTAAVASGESQEEKEGLEINLKSTGEEGDQTASEAAETSQTAAQSETATQTETGTQTEAAGSDQSASESAEGGQPEAQKEKEFTGIRLGSLFQSTYDENGNHKFRILGFGTTTDASGKTTSIKFPGMKLRKDGSGSYHVTKFKVPGVVNVKGNIENGKVSYSDISVLGARYRKDADGDHSFQLGKISMAKGQDGSSSFQFGNIGITQMAGGNSTYEIGDVKWTSSAQGNSLLIGDEKNPTFKTDAGSYRANEIHIGALHYKRGGGITKKNEGGDKA